MERIFYKSDLTDAYTGYPIYIFDTSFLPAPEIVDYDLFIPTLMQWLPKRPYVVIMFSCGLNKINWVWGVSFLKAFFSQNSLGSSKAENLHKIFAVHESWFVKSVSQIFTNFVVSKKTLTSINSLLSPSNFTNNLLISCGSLSELSSYADITRLKISLNVYRHDYEITQSPEIILRYPFEPVMNADTKISPDTDPIFFHHFYQIFNILDTHCDQVELLFHKPGKKLNTEILFQGLMRNQVIWINDWDLHCLASCFKKILSEISTILIDIHKIVLPMKDDLEYTMQIFESMTMGNHSDMVLFQVVSLCRRIVDQSSKTKHTCVSISKCLSHALTHESVSFSNKDQISIVVRFLKNLLHHWGEIVPRFERKFKSVQQIVSGKDLMDTTIEESYNMTYDITLQSSSSSEDDECLISRTSDLLSESTLSNESLDRHAGSPDNLACNERKSPDKGGKPHPASNPLQISNATPVSIRTMSHKNKELHHASLMKTEEPNTKIKEDATVKAQYPPQKYRFSKHEAKENIPLRKQDSISDNPKQPAKKPVIRGRKVGELTKLFEDRSQAIKILNNI